MAKQIIRPMEERDVERVHQLEVAGFATPWSVQSFRDELRNVCARYVVLEDESGIQAYGGIWMIIGEAQVTTLTTDPNPVSYTHLDVYKRQQPHWPGPGVLHHGGLHRPGSAHPPAQGRKNHPGAAALCGG